MDVENLWVSNSTSGISRLSVSRTAPLACSLAIFCAYPFFCRIFLDENLRFILRLWNRMEHLKLRCFGSGSPLLMDLVLLTYFYTTRRFKFGDPTVYFLVGEKNHISRNTVKGRLQHDPQIPTSKRHPTFLRWKTVPLKGCSGQTENNRLSWVFVPPVVWQYYWCASKMDQQDWQLKVGTPTESIWKWCQYSVVHYLLFTKKSHQQPLLSISKDRNPNFLDSDFMIGNTTCIWLFPKLEPFEFESGTNIAWKMIFGERYHPTVLHSYITASLGDRRVLGAGTLPGRRDVIAGVPLPEE